MATVHRPETEDAHSSVDTSGRIAIERHRRGNRWMHWINFPLLTIMIWSGLRIYWADLRDPYVFGIGGWEIYEFFPDDVNETLGLERRLARGMAFHFSFAWLFVINGAAFGLYLWRTGGWRNFVPTLADLRTIPAVLLHEAGIRKDAPPQGKYNGVQQLSYGAILFMGFLVILSGFAIYKPTQLSFLTTIMGGYGGARFIHFATTIGFLLFFVIHILQVARAGLSGLFSMVTGYELLPPEGPKPRNSFAETRCNARIRDIISVTLIPTLVVLFLAALDSEPNPGWLTRSMVGAVVFGAAWEFGWLLLRGATPGKRASGLQVVRRGTEDKPGLVHAAARSVPWLLLLVVIFVADSVNSIGTLVIIAVTLAAIAMVILDKQRRSPLDFISGTEVIAEEHVHGATTPTPIESQEVVR